jgi:hypothetical protein
MVRLQRANELLIYSPVTGDLRWRVGRAKVKAGSIAGSIKSDGYRAVTIDYREYRAHRIAWLLVTGEWPTYEIDHIDGQRANNAWHNLRDVPHLLNQQNRRKAFANNPTGRLGVSKIGKRFLAQIQISGRSTYIGTFDTADEAHASYVQAKRVHHAGWTL